MSSRERGSRTVGDGVVGWDVVVGYLIAWGVGKGRRVGKSLDGDVDLVVDSALERLHETVVDKLGADPALEKFEQEVIAGDEISERTLRRVADALADAADSSKDFKNEIDARLADLARMGVRPAIAVSGERAVAVTGDLDMRADHGSAVVVTAGDITMGDPPPDPSQPGRSGG